MRIFKWTTDFRCSEESPIVLVWISFPYLPVQFMHCKEALFSIASTIGKPLRIDQATASLARPSVARVLVEYDVTQPPLPRIRIGRPSENRQTRVEDGKKSEVLQSDTPQPSDTPRPEPSITKQIADAGSPITKPSENWPNVTNSTSVQEPIAQDDTTHDSKEPRDQSLSPLRSIGEYNPHLHRASSTDFRHYNSHTDNDDSSDEHLANNEHFLSAPENYERIDLSPDFSTVESSNTLLMVLIVVFATMLFPSGLSQEQPVQDIEKCWSSLTSVPSCLTEIIGPLLLGQIGQIGQIGPVCCTAINQITDSCWPKMFPFNPFLAPLLKNFCTAPPPQDAGVLSAASKVASPNLLLTPGINAAEVTECWSSIASTEGCALEVYKSLTTGQINGVGPACCKAIIGINNKCWPKMFPFNPFFPSFLRSNCAAVIV
ncbi:Egg cell-secreted-like protein [Citrus sinensis]|uniref:Egg cell-secreted-like protein n=1 Tax=Citrus sinensis TaxID=2711 RepID=A0ACB8P4V8_CITSI|nr:Egg cell-secreted-like protein [Citrus sinensis]